MARHPQALKFLWPGWYAIVMGLCGLALAWQRAVPLMGEAATGVALVAGAAAAAVFAVLAVATVLRVRRHPDAWAEDRRHPVRHSFIATLPASVLLLATVAVALFGPSGPVRALWGLGAVAQLGVTLWVVGRWWGPVAAGRGLPWAAVTPAMLIPIVGNVLVPLAGVPLGHAGWSAAQLGVGAMFWPVVLALLLVRVAQQGLWPERLLPATLILIAPPSVLGLSLLQFGASPLLAWALWGMGLFGLLWVAPLAPRIRDAGFGLAHWGMSFPLAALASLTLQLATPGSALAVLGPLLLALVSLLVLGLLAATWRGLREGTLLAPEPVAMIAAAPAPPSPQTGQSRP